MEIGGLRAGNNEAFSAIIGRTHGAMILLGAETFVVGDWFASGCGNFQQGMGWL